MSISLTALVDSVAGERIAELEAEVEELQKRPTSSQVEALRNEVERLKSALVAVVNRDAITDQSIWDAIDEHTRKAKAEGENDENL